MNIAIIGAGFTGLTAGLKLAKNGHRVTIFEKESLPGGLATGFKDPRWEWSLEKHYHHCFANDINILNLAKEIRYPIIVKHPETTVYVNDKFYKLDSPIDVLKFSELNIFERLRMGMAIATLRYNPFWKSLERYKVSTILPKLMGNKPYKILWEPLIIKKFGPYANNISLAWFWSRITKRTSSLVYFDNGFQGFINSIVKEIQKSNGQVIFNTPINKISIQKENKIVIKEQAFDKIIVTTSANEFIKITPGLPENYKNKLLTFKWLSVMNLILRLKKPFFKDNTYWLNICSAKYPITGIVEHTNFMSKEYYNNENLVYILNYLPIYHPYLKMDKNELLKVYDPLLKKINNNYKSNIIDMNLFISPFAQPIIPPNYSKLIPKIQTPLRNIYLANMQQVYPWDRGTNYAVELGEKVANIILNQ